MDKNRSLNDINIIAMPKWFRKNFIINHLKKKIFFFFIYFSIYFILKNIIYVNIYI